MAYSIKLYQTASDKRTVNKTLTSVMDVTAEIWGDCDLLSPSLLLHVAPGVNFNYLQILDAPFNPSALRTLLITPLLMPFANSISLR